MKKAHFCIILYIFLIISIGTACQKSQSKTPASPIESYLSTDILPDSLSPANLIELQINSSGSTIYGFEYTANGASLHPTIIMLHGLPGNERNLDLTQNLRRAGYNIIYFNYRGSWGSQGTFSYQNALEDINAVINHISHPQNIQRLKIDTNKIALFGHSMGAGLAMINGLNNPKVKAISAVSIFNPYTIFKGVEAPINLAEFNQYLSTLGMLNCKPEEFSQEMISHLDNYNIEQFVAISRKPILVIDEHKNNIYLANHKKKKNLTYKIWDTDHAFTNKRIALSREIKNWLDLHLAN